MKKALDIVLGMFLLLFWSSSSLSAQVGINILQPDTSAILHLESTDRGFLPPRLTTVQRDAIVQPKPGLQIYNTTDSIMQYFNGFCWLSTWQRNCADCNLNFTAAVAADTIDRIFTNTGGTDLYLEQTAGTPATIALFILPSLPSGMTAVLDDYVVTGSDTVTLTVTADIFTAPGDYPVIIQANCGVTTFTQAFIVTVEPCVEVDIIANASNYDLQAANGLPTGTPICVVATVSSGVELTNNLNNPVFTTGNLHPQSQFGLLNNGNLLARGGDGGVGGGIPAFGSVGGDGTDALDLTISSHIINNGAIFGGGGGGASVGLGVTIPVVNITLAIGAGGGGGAQGGQGGAQTIPTPTNADGQDASNGLTATGGDGGLLNFAIPIPIPPVSVDITPNAFGGDGGDYGVDGTDGSLFVNVSVNINIPFVGNVNILNQNFPDPPPSAFPDGGSAGNAIKRNGNPLIGIGDGNYQSSSLRGQVGN